MQVHDIMTTDVKTVTPGSSLIRVAQLMKENDVGAIPVCDGERIIGIITDRDLVIHAIASGLNPEQTQAEELVSGAPVWVYEDEEVEEAARLMKEHQVRRLPVVSREKTLVGMISLGDISQNEDEQIAGQTLERVSEPRNRMHN